MPRYAALSISPVFGTPVAALIVTVMQAGTPAELVKGPNVLKNRVPGVPIPPGHVFPAQVLGVPSRPSRSACVESDDVSVLDGMVSFVPPVQVGTVIWIVLPPFGKVRFRSNSISVPQAKLLAVWILNGVEFVAVESMTMLG